MKVKISNYTSRLICNIHSNYMNRKYGLVDWPTYAPSKGLGQGKHQPFKEAVVEGLEYSVQQVYNIFNWIWFDRRTQKVKVKIDRWDTWSMDDTLALIIHPMLIQLKQTMHGHPPDLTEQGWNHILDEMIWAFGQKSTDNYDINLYEFSGSTGYETRMTNGFTLFGKYYQNLWD